MTEGVAIVEGYDGSGKEKGVGNKRTNIDYKLSEEPVKEVLANYDFDIIEVKNLVYKGKKGVWWLTGRRGDMVLKKVSSSEATLRFIIACVRHLTHNGVRIPEILKTKDGQDFVVVGKTCFVVSAAINGSKLDAGNLVDIKAMAGEMGRFHKASTGFVCPVGAKQKNHLGTWIEEYEAFLEAMNVYYKAQKEKRQRGQMDNLIVREFPYFYESGKKALEGLRGEEYREWVRLAHKQGCLCHQDFSTANLVSTANGLYVLDTDSIAIDIAARDLRKLLNKVLKRSGRWDAGLAAQIMSAYGTNMKLSKAQQRVVELDLIYPHLFLGAMDKYVYRRDKTWNEENYMARLNEMIIFEKSKSMPAGLGLQGSQGVRR